MPDHATHMAMEWLRLERTFPDLHRTRDRFAGLEPRHRYLPSHETHATSGACAHRVFA